MHDKRPAPFSRKLRRTLQQAIGIFDFAIPHFLESSFLHFKNSTRSKFKTWSKKLNQKLKDV